MLHPRHGARPGDEPLGIGAAVQHEGLSGVEDAVRRHAQSRVALCRDDDGRPEGPQALEEVGGVGRRLQRRELVHHQQHAPRRLLADARVMGEVLEEEAAEPRRLGLQRQALEQDVAGHGVLERPRPVQGAAERAEEGPVPVGDPRHVALGEVVDLGRLRPRSVGHPQGRLAQPSEQVGRRPRRTGRGRRREVQNPQRHFPVVRLAEVRDLHEPVDQGPGVATPGVVRLGREGPDRCRPDTGMEHRRNEAIPGGRVPLGIEEDDLPAVHPGRQVRQPQQRLGLARPGRPHHDAVPGQVRLGIGKPQPPGVPAAPFEEIARHQSPDEPIGPGSVLHYRSSRA